MNHSATADMPTLRFCCPFEVTFGLLIRVTPKESSSRMAKVKGLTSIESFLAELRGCKQGLLRVRFGASAGPCFQRRFQDLPNGPMRMDRIRGCVRLMHFLWRKPMHAEGKDSADQATGDRSKAQVEPQGAAGATDGTSLGSLGTFACMICLCL